MRDIDKKSISIDDEKCILCEACVDTCPGHIFVMGNSEISTRFEEYCIGCGHCISVCPEDAIDHSGLDVSGFLPIREGLDISTDAFYQFLRSRRSIRAYKEKEIPRELIEKLLDISSYAPTAHNWQNVEYIVITNREKIGKLSKMAAEFYGNAAKMIEEGGDSIPEFLRGMAHGFRLNYEFSLQGKDRIFRGAPAVILTFAKADNVTSADNCLYAIFHIVMMAHAMGIGTCINRYFVSAAENVPDILKELEIPEGNKFFGCITLGYPVHEYLKMPARRSPEVKWF